MKSTIHAVKCTASNHLENSECGHANGMWSMTDLASKGVYFGAPHRHTLTSDRRLTSGNARLLEHLHLLARVMIGLLALDVIESIKLRTFHITEHKKLLVRKCPTIITIIGRRTNQKGHRWIGIGIERCKKTKANPR